MLCHTFSQYQLKIHGRMLNIFPNMPTSTPKIVPKSTPSLSWTKMCAKICANKSAKKIEAHFQCSGPPLNIHCLL